MSQTSFPSTQSGFVASESSVYTQMCEFFRHPFFGYSQKRHSCFFLSSYRLPGSALLPCVPHENRCLFCSGAASSSRYTSDTAKSLESLADYWQSVGAARRTEISRFPPAAASDCLSSWWKKKTSGIFSLAKNHCGAQTPWWESVRRTTRHWRLQSADGLTNIGAERKTIMTSILHKMNVKNFQGPIKAVRFKIRIIHFSC